jgi:hypothetical protein
MVQFVAVYVSAGTRYELMVKARLSLRLRTLPAALAAQLAQDTALVESGVAFATVKAPCVPPLEASVHVIAKAVAGTL